MRALACRGARTAVVFGACIVSVCLGQMGEAEAAAPTKLQIQMSPECGSSEMKELLREEIVLHLPATVVETTEEDLQDGLVAEGDARWMLYWRSEDGLGCVVELRDTELVVDVALPTGAEPDDVRDAASIVGFVLATQPARAPEAPEEPPVEDPADEVTPEPEPEPPSRDAEPAPNLEEEPEVVKIPSEEGAESKPIRDRGRETLDEFITTLESFEVASPKLFASMDAVIEKPLSVNMLGSDMKLNVLGTGYTSVTTLEDQTEWLLGAELSLMLSERFALGAAFQSLQSEYGPHRAEVPECMTTSQGDTVPFDPQVPAACQDRIDELDATRLYMATATMEYVWWSENRLNASTQLHLGLGSVTSQHRNLGNPLLVSELRTHVFYDVYPWLQAGMGLGYRVSREIALDAPGIWGRSFNGLSGNVMIRLTLF